MQATLLHSALPFMLNLPPTRVADKLRELLGEAQARPVLDKLMKSTGSSEMIAQRVCLEVGPSREHERLPGLVWGLESVFVHSHFLLR